MNNNEVFLAFALCEYQLKAVLAGPQGGCDNKVGKS